MTTSPSTDQHVLVTVAQLDTWARQLHSAARLCSDHSIAQGVEHIASCIASTGSRQHEESPAEEADGYELAERAYLRTAAADPELCGFFEQSDHALRRFGRALHGAGWLTSKEAESLRSHTAPASEPARAQPHPVQFGHSYLLTEAGDGSGGRFPVEQSEPADV